MRIDFEKMKDKKKRLYESIWKDFDFDILNAKIDNTYDIKSQKKSENSYSFVSYGCKCKTLIDIFKIKNSNLFCQKYDMVISGSGEEVRKILTLHSSSLCALLHFYNITEKNPLTCSWNTNNWKRKVKFTQSFFEYINQVNNNPSNIDIVLIENDTKSKEKIVLFLKSKFSEFYLYQSKRLSKISSKYLDNPYSKGIYNNESFLESMSLKVKRNLDDSFELTLNDKEQEPFYIGGIKQMISHYVGIRNLLAGNYYKGWDAELNQRIVDDAVKDKNTDNNIATIILGEILFDNFNDSEILKSKNEYSAKYKILAKNIANQIDIDNVEKMEVLQETLGYSLFESDRLNHLIGDKVKKFYKYKKIAYHEDDSVLY